jgi:hypothetical protein
MKHRDLVRLAAIPVLAFLCACRATAPPVPPAPDTVKSMNRAADNLGKDLVRRLVESKGGTGDNSEARWREFARLLSSPRLPSGLAVK